MWNHFLKQTGDTVNELGNLIVSDVWGLVATEGISYEHYFYSFTDVKS
jgi:hypothetical protein